MAAVRLSPGLYRNPQGQVFRSRTGALPKPNPVPGANRQKLLQNSVLARQTMPQQSMNAASGQPAGGTFSPTAPQIKDRSAQGYQNQLGRIDNKLSQVGISPERKAQLEARRTAVQGRLNPANPSIPEPVQGPQPNPANPSPVDETVTTQPVGEPQPQDPAFRGIRDFQTDFQDDPVFNAAYSQGQEKLKRLLSARGLTNSGAEVEAYSGLLGNLTSDLGRSYLDIARDDASRWDSQAENEANRRERREDSQWGRFRDLSELMTRQSPMDNAYRATQETSGLNRELGGAKAKNRADRYNRVQAPVGGGGAAGPGPFIPPYPSRPYTGDIQLGQTLGQGAGNQGWLNNLIDFGGNLLGSFF